MTKKINIIQVSGKRKTAIARATLRKGKGRVMVNNVPIELYKPEIYSLRIKEPLILSGAISTEVDIKVNVRGGGFSSQSDAVRIAISKALVEYKPTLKQVFLDYDRAMLVPDVRFKEASKPNSQGQARSKRQKSYR
jgi:small subunit ribosomal protein S9